MSRGKVLVAVSGGVDSSTAMMLLKEQGYEIAAAHMKLWDYSEVGGDEHKDGRCCSLEAINDLHQICNENKIPFYVLNFSNRFRELVIENFVSEYKKGRTPNPCILCNTHLKWEELLRKAMEIGFDYIATGHYAKIDYDETTGRYQLSRGVDDTRDQSYALWGLKQDALARTLLPLGGYRKSEIRELAKKFNLKNAKVAESMEICFVADNDYHRFLREWEEKQNNHFQTGEIVSEDGETLGEHKGIPFYTVGQRRGMGIAHPTPLYVTKIDAKNNKIYVGDNNDLMCHHAVVRDINWVSIAPPNREFRADVKIRYLHNASPATVKVLDDDNNLEIIFDHPQRAITPGQSAVLYEGGKVLAGGFIESSKK